MGGGGMGRTVRIIHSGCAYTSERPSKKRSESTIFLKTVYTSDGVMTLLTGWRDFTSYIHQITKYQDDPWWKRTYIVIILRLVLYKKFQALLSDLRLDVTTAPVAFLGLRFFIFSAIAFLPRLIRLADHLCFTAKLGSDLQREFGASSQNG
jgi:hypothetical protein